MNLKNKTDKELWDILDRLRKENWRIDLEQDKYDIHKEIIRREKDEKDKV